jgi:PAS domain S-box-containing protein
MIKRLKELRHISLKWKLLIPFLFLPVALTVLLVGWSIQGQTRILTAQEEEVVKGSLVDFRQRLELRTDLTKALAEQVALNPIAQQAMAEQNRQALLDLYSPVYHSLTRLPGVKQLHFHLTPPQSFARVHHPDMNGDDLIPYRETINQAQRTGRVIGGIEFGATGFGIRGVAPIYAGGRLVGSVELGSDLDQDFLADLKSDFQCDLTIYVPVEKSGRGFTVLAATDPRRVKLVPQAYESVFSTGRTFFDIVTWHNQPLAVLVGEIEGYDGHPAALIELSLDRSDTIAAIRSNAFMLLVFGLILLLMALVFVWSISVLFLAPIKTMVDQAEEIRAGNMVPQMEVVNRDEFGTLTDALNKMLAGLEDSRRKLANQAHELEIRVRERTSELVASEEKFRALVEHIPLVVYRLEKGMVRSFVSPHIEKLTGWPPEEVVGGEKIWSASIHPDDRNRVLEAKRKALLNGTPLEIEYRFLDRQGTVVDVLDYAEPIKDANGRVLYLEGYMIDIRERKHLQEQTLRAEELKTLGEISARLAHEFRNPLSVVGLTARRLEKTLSEGDQCRTYTRILTEQIARLEQIINMIQKFIQPMGLRIITGDIGSLLESVIEAATPILEEKQIQLDVELDEEIPNLPLDPALIQRALFNLIRNAVYQMPKNGVLRLSVTPNSGSLGIQLIYPAGYLSDDQLRHFFFPFTTEDADTSLVDLPLVPVIIHKHNGVIHVKRQGDDLIMVSIDLPLPTGKDVISPPPGEPGFVI